MNHAVVYRKLLNRKVSVVWVQRGDALAGLGRTKGWKVREHKKALGVEKNIIMTAKKPENWLENIE